MNILDKIVKHKKQEVIVQSSEVPLEELKKQKNFSRECNSMVEALLEPEASGIIAEFKRKSPSKDWIHKDADVEEVVAAYQESGVSAISCLTDATFFGASPIDFEKARKIFKGPILRKDFIVNNYQIYQSKAMGADVILLIAAILSPPQVQQFTKLAHELGMEVLMEFHNEEELKKYHRSVDIIGINNRDLTSFDVSVQRSIDMKNRFSPHQLVISESGLSSLKIVHDLYQKGFRGFLMGEYFMKENNPGKQATEFISELQKMKASK